MTKQGTPQLGFASRHGAATTPQFKPRLQASAGQATARHDSTSSHFITLHAKTPLGFTS